MAGRQINNIPNNRSLTASDGPSRIQIDRFSTLSNRGDTKLEDPPADMLRRVVGKVPHVGIIGAGAAGLRCADVLLQHGVKVTILEGRNRVGGRLCQSDALGPVVDLGPNWIHGTDDNPMLDLAKETGTSTMSWDGRQAVFDPIGKLVPADTTMRNIETTWEIIEQAMKHSNKDTATIAADKSLYDFFKDKVQDLFPGDNAAAEAQRTAILEMSEMWGAFVGSEVQKQSLKFFWLEECIDGENLFVSGTYKKILERIASPALANASVQFEHRVIKINSIGHDEEPQVVLDIDGRESMTFDEVVVTAPLGWLQKNQDAFEPALPKRIQEAISSIGYGTLDKVYIHFPTDFWNEPTIDESSAAMPSPNPSHDHSLPNTTATVAPLHQKPFDSPHDQPMLSAPHTHPGFTLFTRPTYSPANPSSWIQEAINLAALPERNSPESHSTLLFYISGPTSLHIASVLSSLLATSPSSPMEPVLASPKVQPKIFAALQDFFSPYYSLLPSYSKTDPNHQPAAMLATRWASDELAGHGSYSNFQVGLQRGDEDIKVMRESPGLGKERGVWLAGEHTAPLVGLGTVTGAWWSGDGVAKRVLEAWGIELKGPDRVDRSTTKGDDQIVDR